MAGDLPDDDLPEGQVSYTPRDLLEQCLHRHRVHDGFSVQRRALAAQLDCAGVSVEDVEALADSIDAQRRRSSDPAPAILFAILKDAETAKARIRDVRRGATLRQASGKHYPGQSFWRRPGAPTSDEPEPEGWRERELASRIEVLASVDGCDAKTIAATVGLSVDRVVKVLTDRLPMLSPQAAQRALRSMRGAAPKGDTPQR